MTTAADTGPEGEPLAPALARLGIQSDQVYDAEPLPTGLSSARLWRVALREQAPSGATSYHRRVLKTIAPAGDWLTDASGDRRAREIQLWTSGVARDLPRIVGTGVLAYTLNTKTRGALFMRDETAYLCHSPLRPPPGRLPRKIARLLDALAQLHARFWMDPRLRDPALGLMTTRDALLLTAPATIAERLGAGDAHPYLPLAAAGWQAFFALCPPPAAATLRAVFADPLPIIAAIDTLPYTLVHGDVWGPNVGWLPPARTVTTTSHRVLLLDWALAMAAPCAYDPLWLCGTWHALDPARILAAYRARLMRHLTARGVPLAPATWRALVDAAYLRTVLTCGEALGRAAAEAPAGAARRHAERRVRWWANRAASAADRLCLCLPSTGGRGSGG